uniref:Fusion glycoprotein F0 n=5 Tax=avian metapneumovirus TaxID=38525 RepID=FUS_TRTV|nr:RecName: Full=Fusion glycoprotein F0; Contains: RecName: Full=Fusion glycoprotein F2; Contains: RecName: Full=Fusion glycoprotein F1; Flags: Precursor [Turkey rhinotracheitis virus]BAA00726.1 fusion protein prepropolypeptide [Turkey rhinotracheitis virus]
MDVRICLLLFLISNPSSCIQETYNEESCSTVTRGYKSVLRTGWYTNVFNLEIGNVENITCNDGPSLIDTELVLTKNALRELKTVSADQVAKESRLSSPRRRRFVLGAIALGVATAAAVTAGVALAKTIRLEGEVKAIKNALRNTNEAVSTLGNGVRVLATAVNDLKEFISKKLTPAINQNKCNIADIKMAISFGQNNRRFLNVVRQFSDSAGITSAVSLDLMTDDELVRAINRMPTSSGQISLMLNNRAMVRRKGFGILIGVYDGTVVYMVQLPIFGVIETPCWRVVAAPLCRKEKGNYACILREDQGWYCTNAGSTAYYPNKDDCEVRDDYVFCDTAAGINVALEVEQCNYNISTSKYPCKVSTGRHPVSMVALTPLGGLVSCYESVSCSIGSNKVGIIKQLGKGCTHIPNNEADTITIDNTVYQLSKVVGEQRTIKGAPVVNNFNPILFPEDQFNVALDQVFESIDRSQDLIDKSNDLLGADAKSKAGIAIAIVVLVILGIFFLLAVIYYCSRVRKTKPKHDYPATTGHSSMAYVS